MDKFLNGITMYRLMLYYLVGLLMVASFFAVFNLLPFNIFPLIFSALFLAVISWLVNKLFARVFNVPNNLESAYITALILTFIITPVSDFAFLNLAFLFLAAVLAMASKYILVIRKKHIFNPAAFAVFLTSVIINQSASWWVGTSVMLPFVLLGGLLMVRKIKRVGLAGSFLFAASVIFFGFSLIRGVDVTTVVRQLISDSPIIFFVFVMLTEPQTTPPKKSLQIAYGGLVGFLFASPSKLGFLYLTPELSLLAGNIFSFLVSPKEKLILKLKEKIQLAPGIYDFVFSLNRNFKFLPGQYLEWTLSHASPDSRGNRRYFTIASPPTENNLRIGIRFNPNPSSFKKSLIAFKTGNQIVASQLAGDFTLPKDKDQKLVFIAGGVGITPFRSIIKYLLDVKEKRDIVLFFSNQLAEDIVYKDIFDSAFEKLGIKTIYTLIDIVNIPKEWKGKTGYIDAKMIKEEVPDYKERIFYISGPHSMVDAVRVTLKKTGLSGKQIKLDFFTGYA